MDPEAGAGKEAAASFRLYSSRRPSLRNLPQVGWPSFPLLVYPFPLPFPLLMLLVPPQLS